MKTVTLQIMIGLDGLIHLDIASELPPGPAEVKLTIEPTGVGSITQDVGIRSRTLEKSIALEDEPREISAPIIDRQPSTRTCSGLFLGRLPEDHDIDAAMDEMNSQWKAKLLDMDR
jgi:hypothetical protein